MCLLGNELFSDIHPDAYQLANAVELFTCPDVDGGLVGGASLNATEFISIVSALS